MSEPKKAAGRDGRPQEEIAYIRFVHRVDKTSAALEGNYTLGVRWLRGRITWKGFQDLRRFSYRGVRTPNPVRGGGTRFLGAIHLQ